MITKIDINLPGIRLDKLRLEIGRFLLLMRRAPGVPEGDRSGAGDGDYEWG